MSLGPVLPSFRYPTGHLVGADIVLGKTHLTSYDALVQRYAFIAGQPQGQIAKVQQELTDMAIAAGLTGAVAGLVVPGLWLLLGPRRRSELGRSPRSMAAVVGATALIVAVATVTATRPWDDAAEDRYAATAWQPIGQALPGVPIPAQAQPLQVDASLLTSGTERLVESALDSYRKSSQFYSAAARQAKHLAGRLHQPDADERVAVLVADRHDNIGMDPVARAIADAGGATFLLDAGDDTSTGSSWEAFSLESLDDAFRGYDDRFFVAGNHDHGTFVTEQARRLGFTALEGEPVDGPGGIRFLGVNDPRSSGLGNWKDEHGLSYGEVADRLADAACASEADGQRINVVLVHSASLGAPALQRGCVDAVLGGHLHVIVGPDAVTGSDGDVGWSYTTGTTGGAAYAIAIGTKPRRDATVSLVTFRDRRAVGIQWVTLSPLGDFTVGPYTPLPANGGGTPGGPSASP
jgi:hypothetical protein